MPRSSTRLQRAVAKLRRRYGPSAPHALSDPWELIVWETCAYLVDDERRARTFARLRSDIGLAPAQILAAPRVALVAAIAEGGMLPGQRADKLRTAASLALDASDGSRAGLRALAALPRPKAMRAMKKFPGMGDPGAEKLLLLSRSHAALALESNGLRVLNRLGVSAEKRDYNATYRAMRVALTPELTGVNEDFDWLIAAHHLLRRHGQEVCRRAAPECGHCALTLECDYFARRPTHRA